MIEKIEAEALAEGVYLAGRGEKKEEPSLEAPGVPNWEIEELKSITDGHILLRTPTPEASPAPWTWNLDPYKSLPRLGTDALHPALCSVEAHKLRLKMLQGRDRAVHMHDTLLAENTLDSKERMELKFVELMLEQPAGEVQSVEEQVARLVIVENPRCPALRADGGCTPATLGRLAKQLLASPAGQRAVTDVSERGEISEEARVALYAEVDGW